MKKNLSLLIILILTLAVVLTACGGGDADISSDAKAGKELFAQSVIGDQAGCGTCHSLEKDVVIVGPSMVGIASRAGSRVSGETAEQYIRESILTPDAYLVEGFPSGTMPQVWGAVLSEEQINQLIAYLMTLK